MALKSELFSYVIDEYALALAERMDGKWLRVTHTPDLTAQGVVDHYEGAAASSGMAMP